MTRPVAVGVDGSDESVAAVGWAATEAAARGVPLRVVCAVGDRTAESGPGQGPQDPSPSGPGGLTAAARATATGLCPTLETEEDLPAEKPVRALLAAAEAAELLVLGSRGLGGLKGFVVGSVGLPVLAHATRPVVAVRRNGLPGPEASGPVTVGLDLKHPPDTVLDFAFRAASRRRAVVRVVHAWSVQALYAYPSALPDPEAVARAGASAERSVEQALRPFRVRFPGVPVEVATAPRAIAPYLLESGEDAGLLVIGRRVRRRPFPQRLGSVAHAALHHSARPVAVVPYEPVHG